MRLRLSFSMSDAAAAAAHACIGQGNPSSLPCRTLVVKGQVWSVLGFRLEEGILSGWSRGEGVGKTGAHSWGSVGGGVSVGFKSRKAKTAQTCRKGCAAV